MVEMIIAITIIGIAFLSVPVILRITSDSIELAMESRGFYHGLAKMQIVRNMAWDEANVDDLATSDLYYVLETLESPNLTGMELSCNAFSQRPGHYSVGGQASALLGQDSGDFDDIDDFDKQVDTNPNGYRVDVNVSYTDYIGGNNFLFHPNIDGASAGTTNLKRIDVFVTSDLGVVDLRYSYYAANIGRPKPFIKPNP